MSFLITDVRKHFQRTVCACESCVACCRYKPGMLGVGDIEAICSYCEPAEVLAGSLDRSEWWHKFILEHFEASEGAMVIRDGLPGRIPTIVPKLLPTGCIFLENERCRIHKVAPCGCAYMDVHMAASEGTRRSALMLQTIAFSHMTEDWYHRYWNLLNRNGCRSLPLQERQANLMRAIDAIEAKQKKKGKKQRGRTEKV